MLRVLTSQFIVFFCVNRVFLCVNSDNFLVFLKKITVLKWLIVFGRKPTNVSFNFSGISGRFPKEFLRFLEEDPKSKLSYS